MTTGWTPEQLPDLAGKTFVITGGNSGIGFELAKHLTAKKGRVIITTRDEAKGKGALEAIRAAVPGADVDFVVLDLAEPASVSAGVAALRAKCTRIDALVNNAGVMQTPEVRTSEGFELQLATNHLGHFRLNSQLFDLVEAAGGRIVPVSSIVHRQGVISLDDLNSKKGYSPTAAYGQSKLANLMYALELQRRLAARKSKVSSIPAHPGYSATNLQSAGVGMKGGSTALKLLYKVTNAVVAQSAAEGAYPLAMAAAAPEAKPGSYYGPNGMMEMRGKAAEGKPAARALDEDVARKLWDATEALVGPFFR
ncbi:MAG: oxidoreductase [Myxococcaceae bacterium]